MVFSRIPRNICCWPICGHGRYLFSTFPLLFWFCLRGKMKNYDHTSVVGELWFIGDLFRYQEEHCFIFLGPLFKVKASFTFLSPFLDQLTIDSPFLISSLVFIPLTSQSSLRQVHSSPISTSKSTYSALFSSSSSPAPSPSTEGERILRSKLGDRPELRITNRAQRHSSFIFCNPYPLLVH